MERPPAAEPDHGGFPRLAVTLHRYRRPARLAVTGEIDVATVDHFDHAVRMAAAQVPSFVIDLSAATFIGAAGVRVLFAHRTHVIAVVAAPNSIIARALSLAGYPTLLPPRHSPGPRLPRQRNPS